MESGLHLDRLGAEIDELAVDLDESVDHAVDGQPEHDEHRLVVAVRDLLVQVSAESGVGIAGDLVVSDGDDLDLLSDLGLEIGGGEGYDSLVVRIRDVDDVDGASVVLLGILSEGPEVVVGRGRKEEVVTGRVSLVGDLLVAFLDKDDLEVSDKRALDGDVLRRHSEGIIVGDRHLTAIDRNVDDLLSDRSGHRDGDSVIDVFTGLDLLVADLDDDVVLEHDLEHLLEYGRDSQILVDHDELELVVDLHGFIAQSDRALDELPSLGQFDGKGYGLSGLGVSLGRNDLVPIVVFVSLYGVRVVSDGDRGLGGGLLVVLGLLGDDLHVERVGLGLVLVESLDLIQEIGDARTTDGIPVDGLPVLVDDSAEIEGVRSSVLGNELDVLILIEGTGGPDEVGSFIGRSCLDLKDVIRLGNIELESLRAVDEMRFGSGGSEDDGVRSGILHGLRIEHGRALREIHGYAVVEELELGVEVLPGVGQRVLELHVHLRHVDLGNLDVCGGVDGCGDEGVSVRVLQRDGVGELENVVVDSGLDGFDIAVDPERRDRGIDGDLGVRASNIVEGRHELLHIDLLAGVLDGVGSDSVEDDVSSDGVGIDLVGGAFLIVLDGAGDVGGVSFGVFDTCTVLDDQIAANTVFDRGSISEHDRSAVRHDDGSILRELEISFQDDRASIGDGKGLSDRNGDLSVKDLQFVDGSADLDGSLGDHERCDVGVVLARLVGETGDLDGRLVCVGSAGDGRGGVLSDDDVDLGLTRGFLPLHCNRLVLGGRDGVSALRDDGSAGHLELGDTGVGAAALVADEDRGGSEIVALAPGRGFAVAVVGDESAAYDGGGSVPDHDGMALAFDSRILDRQRGLGHVDVGRGRFILCGLQRRTINLDQETAVAGIPVVGSNAVIGACDLGIRDLDLRSVAEREQCSAVGLVHHTVHGDGAPGRDREGRVDVHGTTFDLQFTVDNAQFGTVLHDESSTIHFDRQLVSVKIHSHIGRDQNRCEERLLCTTIHSEGSTVGR